MLQYYTMQTVKSVFAVYFLAQFDTS